MTWTATNYFTSKTELEAYTGINSGTNATDCTEAECNTIIPLLEGIVAEYLVLKHRFSASEFPYTAAKTGYYTIKNCIIGLFVMYVQRREYMKRTNRIESAQFFLNYAPTLTLKMREDLDLLNLYRVDSHKRDDSSL